MVVPIVYEDLTELLPIQWDNPDFLWVDKHTAYGVCEIITQDDFQQEGLLLAHCLGTKRADDWNVWHRMFSIRDREGLPHATILTTRNPKESPYGFCRDLGTGYPMSYDGEQLWILQVRGRGDHIAYIDFHRIARRFYRDHEGRIPVSDSNMDHLLSEAGEDRDFAYHFDYKYDPWPFRQHYNFTWKDVEKVEAARKEGLVK